MSLVKIFVRLDVLAVSLFCVLTTDGLPHDIVHNVRTYVRTYIGTVHKYILVHMYLQCHTWN